MAPTSPTASAHPPRRCVAAYAAPIPVIAVNIGCASGARTPRNTNVTPSSGIPPTSGRASAEM